MEDDCLIMGDKILLEWEFFEWLGVGCFFVWEVFRVLELIGLIEIRRGEGMFIKEVGDY